MSSNHYRVPAAGITLFALLALGACARQGADEMGWARAALERNHGIEIVATDPSTRTFTVREKDSGQLRMVRADELVGAAAAGTAAPATAAAVASVPAAPTAAPQGTAPAASPTTGEPAAADSAPAEVAAAPAPDASRHGNTLAQSGGRVLESGPGYSIKAAAASSAGSARGREVSVTNAALERRHEPIVCQGARLLQIDNRNLVFDGDAVSAEDGCEIHITNSHISASGIGVSARAANVHIDNSQIEGEAASIDASEGAQIYAASSRFRGLSRRLDSAAFHDLGGNVWN